MSKNISTEQKDMVLIEKLNSENENIFLEALAEIIEKGNTFFITHMIDLYKNTKSESKKQKLFGTFIDLKDLNTRPYIINYINDANYNLIKKDLLNICWQSSLIFEDYIDTFINIFVNDDFELAFEAFTIIELFENKFPVEVIDKNISLLNSHYQLFEESKKKLTPELINILKNLSE